jgi:DNA-binding CsgD family transcriptional regulator
MKGRLVRRLSFWQRVEHTLACDERTDYAVGDMAVPAGDGRELRSSRIARPEVALEALCDLALTASEPMPLDLLARRTVDLVRDLLRADGGSLFLWRDRSAQLEPIMANDPGWDLRAVRTFLPGQGVTGATYQLGRPLIIRDYPISQHAVQTAVAQGLKSGVAVPLKIGRRRVGVLSARSYRHLPWTQQDVRLLSLAASVVGPALEAASSAGRVSALRLTPKETQVLADLMAGRNAKSIARASGLSEATVRTHIRSVLAKFGVRAGQVRRQLAARGGRAGARPGLRPRDQLLRWVRPVRRTATGRIRW